MEKLLPADDFDLTGLVRPGDRIICGQGTSEPTALTSRLVAQRHAIADHRVSVSETGGERISVICHALSLP
jgi:hypothetical protein